MTPPPTITTRAREGRSGTGDVLQETGEARRAEGGRGLLVALQTPAAEVVVDRARCGLDEAPQRPAVLAAQRLETHSRQAGRRQGAVVRLDVRRHLLGTETALRRGVAELERRVVVAGVLVVDQAGGLTVVDEVGGQQVVVARHR